MSFNILNGTATINNSPTDAFYGQRVDVFASADGSVQWNTKNLERFAQTVDMNRQDYTFTISEMFTKPSPNANLKWAVINQPGNTFTPDPIITILPDGRTLSVNYPWKSKNVSDTVKLAQTILVYWDFAATKGILPVQKPARFRIDLHALNIIDNRESSGGGDCIFYANVGGNWLMLNEFSTSEPDILKGGLGDAQRNTVYNLQTPKLFVYIPFGQASRLSSRVNLNHFTTRKDKDLR